MLIRAPQVTKPSPIEHMVNGFLKFDKEIITPLTIKRIMSLTKQNRPFSPFDMFGSKESLWILVIIESFTRSDPHKWRTFKDTLRTAEVHRKRLLLSHVNKIVGLYTDYDIFLNFLTKEYSYIPGNLLDYDSLIQHYTYTKIMQVAICVLHPQEIKNELDG